MISPIKRYFENRNSKNKNTKSDVYLKTKMHKSTANQSCLINSAEFSFFQIFPLSVVEKYEV